LATIRLISRAVIVVGMERVLSPDAQARFWSRIPRTTGCWEWKAGCFDNGYGAFKSQGKQYHAHRLVWELTRGKIPSGLLVCHKCDNPRCCNPEHLFLGTVSDNAKDAVAKGRWNPWNRGRGWSYREGNDTFCKGCKQNKNHKPSQGCPVEHYEYYAHMLSLKNARRKKQAFGRN
jgi:hypothetical protein